MMLVSNDKASLRGYAHILVPDSNDLAEGGLSGERRKIYWERVNK